MSMTDRGPSRTHRAAALLPETPHYVGMVDVETALRDSPSVDTGGLPTESGTPRANRAGARTPSPSGPIGCSACPTCPRSTDAPASNWVGSRGGLREQALSVRLTDSAMEGEASLTMRDEAKASGVVGVAEGTVAILKLSGDRLDERHRTLLDGVQIAGEGAIVHVQFSLDRDMLREYIRDQRRTVSHPPPRQSVPPPWKPGRGAESDRPHARCSEDPERDGLDSRHLRRGR